MNFDWMNFLDAMLFAFLGAASAARLCETDIGTIRTSHVMLVTLLVYCGTRAAALVLIALHVVPDDEGLVQNQLNAVPGTFYALFQTALIWRWVNVVSKLLAVLHLDSFRAGEIARLSSLTLGILQPLLNVAGFIDLKVWRFSSLKSNDWNLMSQLYGGALYMYNGLAFLCLGLMILQLWKVWRSTDQHYERLRIFLIAAVFASVTFFRGLMLVLFLFSNANKRVANMVHSSWGAPAVLFAEWWSIVLTLFVLPTLWSAKTADVEPESRSLRSSFGHGAGGKKPSIICSATSNREKAKTNDEHYAVNR